MGSMQPVNQPAKPSHKERRSQWEGLFFRDISITLLLPGVATAAAPEAAIGDNGKLLWLNYAGKRVQIRGA